MITFDDARRTVAQRWPDYTVAPYGYEVDAGWIVLLLPATAGGRLPLVAKSDGSVRWINSFAPEYDQNQPVGDWPLVNQVVTMEPSG